MSRIIKKHEERKLEIIDTAENLFREKGYNETSVNEIINKIGIAKGTFYHYFKSKDDLLEALVDKTLEGILKSAKDIANNESLSAIEKMRLILSVQIPKEKDVQETTKNMNQARNRELNERTNVKIILNLSPIITKIVKQGVSEGSFNAENILETIQFLFVGSQFFFDDGLFNWNTEEWITRRKVMQNILEKGLGAKKESLSFISEFSIEK